MGDGTKPGTTFVPGETLNILIFVLSLMGDGMKPISAFIP
jgi:hypothetical protein